MSRSAAVPAIRTVACRIATGVPAVAGSGSAGAVSTIATASVGVVRWFPNPYDFSLGHLPRATARGFSYSAISFNLTMAVKPVCDP